MKHVTHSWLEQIKERDILPRFHGNGFLQIYIDRTQVERFHVWHPDLKPQREHNAQIHDHRFHMRSRILCGSLKHITHDIIPQEYFCGSPVYEATHSIYEIQGASKFSEANMVNVGRVHLRKRHEYIFSKGSYYDFRAGKFHESYVGDPTRITATIIERDKETEDANEWARIAVEQGIAIKDITHAFEPELQPSTDKMWKCLHEAIDLIKGKDNE